MGKPLSPLPVSGARGNELPAYVSNGMIGLRVREVPLLLGSAIVNGVLGLHPEEPIASAIPVPYPLAGDIGVGEAWLSEQPWAVEGLEQAYDFGSGELFSHFLVRFGDAVIGAQVITFASRSDPALVLQRVELTSEASCDVRVRAMVATADARGRVDRRLLGEEAKAGDGALLWVPEGGMSSCGIAFFSECVGADEEPQIRQKHGSGPLTKEYRIKLEAGEPLCLRQITAMIPSCAHHRPEEESVRRLAKGCALGFDRLQALNRERWEEIWQGRIFIDGASSDHQRLIDAGLFYLNSSAHASSPAATSMFGLASWPDYNYYYGHVMWDIDAFCVPPLLLLQPGAAQSLLDFRAGHVDAAKAYAKLDGHHGMRFPWQAAPLSGEEASPGAGPAAAKAAHASLHVARAFALHADVTRDHRYLRDHGWEILSGVADWLVARMSMTGRGAELLRAMGPAEVSDPPDNDSFTLMTAHDLLRRTIRLGDAIRAEVPPAWRKLLDSLCIPRRSDGVIASHEGFRVTEEKGATPSPLAGLFPMEYPASARVRKATLDFFLPRWPGYVGSPMLPALYPVWAAMTGNRGLALTLFEEGYAAYDKGRFHQCLEYREDHPDSRVPAGPFMANIGGMLMTMLIGLPGLEISDQNPTEWGHRAVVLPEGWKGIHVDRLYAGGCGMRLSAEQGAERARLTPS